MRREVHLAGPPDDQTRVECARQPADQVGGVTIDASGSLHAVDQPVVKYAQCLC